jgi:transcriptional regulator with XRE-family HTH domain
MEKIENLKSIITSNLIKYRKQAGLTQAQLASKLGYSDKTVSKWEREEGVPDIYILKEIADLYGVTVNDLISPSLTVGEKIKETANKF